VGWGVGWRETKGEVVVIIMHIYESNTNPPKPTVYVK
jgi:hypothetical protein